MAIVVRPNPMSFGRPREVNGELWQVITQLIDRVNYLVQQQANMISQPPEVSKQEVASLRVAISAVQDVLTQGSAFAGAGSLQPVSTESSLSATGSGFTISGTTGSGIVTISSPSTARTALGLGTLAVLNSAATVTPVAGTASAAYDAATQTLINDLKTAVNAVISSLEAAGIFV